MFSYLTSDVSFRSVVHNDQKCHVEEGFGGQSLNKWPVYGFFSLYLSGNKKSAFDNYVSWYTYMLDKYGAISNYSEGGFHKGSLFKLIEKTSGLPLEQTPEEVVEKVIRDRVEQRFELLENIRRDGYKQEIERIDGVRKNGKVYLKGGHHRAAILLALGYNELPGVLVFPNVFIYKCFLFLRKIKGYVSF